MSEESHSHSHHESSHTYALIKPTGNGAFGMVYKAKDGEEYVFNMIDKITNVSVIPLKIIIFLFTHCFLKLSLIKSFYHLMVIYTTC